MNHNIDKLFKNKLGESQIAPSSEAWNKLQVQLKGKQKRKYVFFYKVASVFLLFLISLYAFFTLNDITNILTSGVNTVADKEAIKETKEIENQNNSTLIEDATPSKLVEIDPKNFNEKQLAENKILKKEIVDHKAEEREIIEKSEITKEIVNTIKIITIDPEILPDTDILVAGSESDNHQKIEEQQPPAITITYKKGRSNNETATKIAAVENENTALKKFLKLAKDIKFSEVSLADIRDSKEDLMNLEITKMKN